MSVYDTDPNELIKKAAEKLKPEITMPEWAKFAKTSPARDRTPLSQDWWWMRAASILRKIYVQGPVGVNKLSVKYGGKKNMGHKPNRFYRGSRKIIRTLMQQLEEKGYIIKAQKDAHKGRIVTNKGKSLLDKAAR